MSDEVAPLGRRAKPSCPICGKPSAVDFQPFCSRRCRMVDLGRWFGENYNIPGAPRTAAKDDDDDAQG